MAGKSKFRLIGFVLAVGIIFASQLSSAYYLPPVREVIDSTIQAFIDVFEPVISVLLGGAQWSSSLLFERLLVFMIVLSIVYVTLGKIPMFAENAFVRWVVSLVIPLLSIRFMEPGWLLAIIIQYKVLSIALTSILPFIIYFFFIHNLGRDSGVVRKVGWILFMIVYLGLWASIEDELQSAVYFWTFVASLALLIFDGTIHHYFIKQQLSRAGVANKWQHIAQLRGEIDETQRAITAGHIPEAIGKSIIRKKQKHIEWLLKHG
ncbi:hypothetical protein D6817_01490 [Candidatus Pacearchaeota archaeon]|nr:MAG: hypothetical protein D6817_01490 [Candidatus Pacearchaeota archaeon]